MHISSLTIVLRSSIDCCAMFLRTGDVGVRLIAVAMAGNTSLRVLDLNDTQISNVGGGGAPLFEMMIENHTLKEVHLRYNMLGNQIFSLLLRLLRENRTTLMLDLRNQASKVLCPGALGGIPQKSIDACNPTIDLKRR